MKNPSIMILALLVLYQCKPMLQVSKVETSKNQSISSDISEDAEITNVIKPYKQQLDGQMNQVLSHTDVDLNKLGNNSNLGLLLSDMTKSAAQEWANKNGGFHIDASILNTGGLRSAIPKGNIKVYHVFEVMPFDNALTIVKMSAENVKEIFAYYLKYTKNNPVSGLEISIKNKQLTKALIGGKEPEDGKFYYIATSDYLANGGDNMVFFSKAEHLKTNLKLRDVFIDQFKKNPHISEIKEERLSFDTHNNE